MFPLRITSNPWSARRIIEEADSADTPALPNRVAAGPKDLKAVRRREHKTLYAIMGKCEKEQSRRILCLVTEDQVFTIILLTSKDIWKEEIENRVQMRL
jgi:hypothetical protein